MTVRTSLKDEPSLAVKRWQRFRSHRRAVVSSCVLAFIVLVSLTSEFWANNKPFVMITEQGMFSPALRDYHPSVFGQEGFVTDYRKLRADGAIRWAVWPLVEWSPLETNKGVDRFPSPPSADNWFGTDDRGRDVLARLIYGFRYSFAYACLVWLLTFSLGVLLGAAMGFWGGWVDLLGQRVVETFESVPTLLLLILLVSVFGASMPLLVVMSTLFGWMFISVYMRAEFLKLRRFEFVEAARAMGLSNWKIIFKHILPNALGPIVTFSPFALAAGITSLAILDYLGFGLPPPTPSWGELLQQAQKNFTNAWWLAVFPSGAWFLSLLVLNLIGEGIRDAFDPRG
jgi:microcin C transport system permease protein